MTTKQLDIMLSEARWEGQDGGSNNDRGEGSLLSSNKTAKRSWKNNLSKTNQMVVILDNHGEDWSYSDTFILAAQVERSQRWSREFQKKIKRMWATDSGRKKKIQKIAWSDYIATSGDTTFKVNKAYIGDKFEQQQYAECIMMSVDNKGETQILRCLFNTGCSKSIIMKKFTKLKWWTKQPKEDQVRYTMWSGSFDTHYKASMGIQLVEFERKRKTNRQTWILSQRQWLWRRKRTQIFDFLLHKKTFP